MAARLPILLCFRVYGRPVTPVLSIQQPLFKYTGWLPGSQEGDNPAGAFRQVRRGGSVAYWILHPGLVGVKGIVGHECRLRGAWDSMKGRGDNVLDNIGVFRGEVEGDWLVGFLQEYAECVHDELLGNDNRFEFTFVKLPCGVFFDSFFQQFDGGHFAVNSVMV